MAQTNTAYALEALAKWCRSHGIYEIRDVLAKAACLADGAESSDLLAQALEEAALAADVVADAKPASAAAAPNGEPDPEIPQVKPRRRARADAGQFKADDPATAAVNEAWDGGDAA